MSYDIGIPEIICTKRYEDTNGISIKYDAEASSRPTVCTNPMCQHQIKPHLHSSKTNLIHDVKSEGKLVYINLTIRRYRCPDCKYVFPDEFTFFGKNSHITNRLRQEFVNRCIKGETFSYIANDYSVDHKTVAAAFKDYATANQKLLDNNYTPRILGIDEAHIDDHYRLVLTDVYDQRLLDIKRDNKQRTVKAYLRTLDKSICKVATMDFAPAYAKCVHSVMPDTTIVIDKFHVIQEINRCLDRVRIDLQNSYRDQGVDIRRFKRAKYLFMTNWEDLTESGINRLQAWFTDFPELYVAYMTKETFRDIYLSAKDFFDARRMFHSWMKTIPDFPRFEPMRTTMTRREDHILNYFKYHWTNAYTESVNNQIKRIEKAGRGYKFDTLRERCLLEINTPKPDRFDPRTAQFVDTETGEIQPSQQEVKARELYAVMPFKAAHKKPLELGLAIRDVVDPLELYLECFDQTTQFSIEMRLLTYAERIAAMQASQNPDIPAMVTADGKFFQNMKVLQDPFPTHQE